MVSIGEFGRYVRQLREGLGLSLRAFGRRTGFDSANMSRLERGVHLPPRAEKSLAALAVGLGLKKGSPEWKRFMTLAGLERVPRELRAAARRGHGHRSWVKARDLEGWAGRVDARGGLPGLVRRLIRATAEGVIRVEAPGEEQAQRPGWDGVVEAAGESEFVPGGSSRWEMGVEKAPENKAEEDFAKRTKKTPLADRRRSTFVFVTPRKWQKKQEWIDKKKRAGWREVRVYDSATLEEWLECAPAVDIWMARHLNVCPRGVIDADGWWENLEGLTEPVLGPEVYMASRGKATEELREWIDGQAGALLIETGSAAEGVDFVVAATRGGELQEKVAARAVVVETREAWQALSEGDGRLVLVAGRGLEVEAELVGRAVRHGHHALVFGRDGQGTGIRQVKLRRVSPIDLQNALIAQGVGPVKAVELARACGGSITVLKRLTAGYPETVRPAWSRPPEAGAVAPLLLAGGWSGSSKGDRRAVARLAGVKYADVEALAERWSAGQDPMLRRRWEDYELISRDDSWALASYAVSDEHLRRFREAVQEVLGEVDPACDLPVNDRWQAEVVGKGRGYSKLLRGGLAESLALLGARGLGEERRNIGAAGLAAGLIRALLHGKGWEAWASLSAELPLLAEAAPDAFLDAVEKDLRARSPVVVRLFDAEASPLLGRHPHTGLLFALETLAWDEAWLPRVCLALARLDELVPKVQMGNTPVCSLVSILMPWFPQTAARLEVRVKVIQLVVKNRPVAGWKLLLALVPQWPMNVLPTRRPAFRDWALGWVERGEGGEAVLEAEACSDLLVEMIGEDVGRLKEAIELIENLIFSAQAKLRERLKKRDVSALSAEDRWNLVQVIRDKVNWWRQLGGTVGGQTEGLIAEMDSFRERLEAGDVVTENAWLFGDYWTARQVVAGEARGVDAEKALVDRSTVALAEVRAGRGWEGVLALAGVAAMPDQVGWMAGQAAREGDDARVLPALFTDDREGVALFAKGYTRARQVKQGWDWVQGFGFKAWSDEQVLEFALALPVQSEAWQLVEGRGEAVAESYWKRVQPHCYGIAADVEHACRMLAKTGRGLAAAGQLAVSLNRNLGIEPDLMVHVLEAARESLVGTGRPAELGNARYDLQFLLGKLQDLVEAGDGRVEVGTVAKLEWAYLGLLDGHRSSPKVLHTWLGERPGVFVELIEIVFRKSEGEEEERPPLTEAERSRAEQAFRLLHSWERVPGTQPDGTVEENALRGWIAAARSAAESAGRMEAGDTMIGEVLAHAPHAPDGNWPCEPVRDAIEEFGCEEMVNGFEVGILNKREATWRSAQEGGNQERDLARQYFAWADAIKVEWPSTAAALRRVGQQYEADAARWDAEGEKW